MSSLTSLTVYASSRDQIDAKFFEVAREIGRILAQAEISLVYGGGNVGLMGEMARAAHEYGGQVVGVIPQALKDIEGVAYDVADEMIVTQTMRERKRIMYERGQGYLALPGGYGTLEEFMEVMTLRQLGYHDRPIVLLNTDGFYDPLLLFFDRIQEQGFARTVHRPLFRIVSHPGDVLDAFEA